MCMYVCMVYMQYMYECMYVCIVYVCLYVCIYIYIYTFIYSICMHICICTIRMYMYVYESIWNICKYSYVHIHVYTPAVCTVYAVHLVVILTWQFGEFSCDHQILCTVCQLNTTHNHVYYEQCTLNITLFAKLNIPPMCITSQFAKLIVCQVNRVYGTYVDWV